jgi:ketosteroid isomerase-like protein
METSDPGARRPAADIVRSLHRAVDAHDLEGIVAHFAPDYVLDDPIHPDRSFVGADQVRRNWSRLLGSMADLALEERRLIADGSEAWTEIVIRGHLADGTERVLRGVMVFGTGGGLISTGTFYLAPVVHDGLDADAAVRALAAEPGR